MITVACVLRSGGDFGREDVIRLVCGVERHMPDGEDYRFVCLTDCRDGELHADAGEYGMDIEPLRHGWPGWWSKLEMFRLSDGVVIYLDLDTVVVGSLAPLIEAVRRIGGLFMIRDLYRRTVLQSGVVAWTGPLRWPYDEFEIAQRRSGNGFKRGIGGLTFCDGRNRYRGDGEWLRARALERGQQLTPLQDVVAGIYSYKATVQQQGLPGDACLVCFHGKPRPGDVSPQPSWLRENTQRGEWA